MPDIARGVRAFTFGTAISRVMGLVREQVFAGLFGASHSTDAFNAAFRIPNLLRDMFAETALSAAFVPVLTSQKQKSKEAENLLASNIFNTLLVVVGLVTVAGIVFSPGLAKVIALGFGSVPGKLALTGKLTAITFPFLLFVALAAWAMSYLNTEGSFFTPSLAPAFFNIFSILVPLGLFGYYTARGGDPIFGAAFGVTIGGLLQFAIQVPGLFKKGFRYSLFLNFRDPDFRRVMALFIPVAIGLAGSRINVAVNTVLVSFLEKGSMSWLNYAFRIMHLPLGLFGIAVGTVALPTFSRFVIENNLAEIRRTLTDSLKMVFVLTIPTSVIIAFLSHPITRVIYQHGKFSASDTNATAGALVLYILGVPFVAALRNVAGVFYAYKDARWPMYASFASIGLNRRSQYHLDEGHRFSGLSALDDDRRRRQHRRSLHTSAAEDWGGGLGATREVLRPTGARLSIRGSRGLAPQRLSPGQARCIPAHDSSEPGGQRHRGPGRVLWGLASPRGKGNDRLSQTVHKTKIKSLSRLSRQSKQGFVSLVRWTNTNAMTHATSPFKVAPEATLRPPDPEEPVPSVPPSEKPTGPPPLRGPKGGLRRNLDHL